MVGVRQRLARAATLDCPVLIWGESGTGKTTAARMLARLRGAIGLVHASVFESRLLESSVSESSVFESSLFESKGGIGILDDLDSPDPVRQHRLTAWLDASACAIVTSVHGPGELLARIDPRLFHRIVAFDIRLPPLRERLEDLSELVAHIAPDRPPLHELARLREHVWPGNIRELTHVLGGSAPRRLEPESTTSLRAAEAAHIRRILTSVGWNKTRAAELLGIQRSTVYQKIKEHSLVEG